MKQIFVRRTQYTQCAAGLSCDRMIVEHKHDEYCNIYLNRGDCNMVKWY